MRFINYLGAIILLLSIGCTNSTPTKFNTINSSPNIFPDYTDITVPYNIAPLNFIIEEKGDKFYIEVNCEDRTLKSSASDGGDVQFPIEEWHRLLEASKGRALNIDIYSYRDGSWSKFKPVKIEVKEEPIDSNLIFRKILPGYSLWSQMGTYQRDLTNFDISPIVETGRGDISKESCINCHTIDRRDPSNFMIHYRGDKSGSLIFQRGRAEKMRSLPEGQVGNCTYSNWHPTEDIIAFSVNKVRQLNHISGYKYLEVFDLESDIILYSVEKNSYFYSDEFNGTREMETFPCWTPSGDYLYFCQADTLPSNKFDNIESIRYNLMRISYNIESCKFGKKELVIDAAAMGKSVSFPRFSHESGALMVTLSNYGNFSIWHPESDLYMVDIENQKLTRLSCSSDNVDSYHSWSSSDRWFVFSSKCMNKINTKPYICYIDSNGVCGKPFVIPQEIPAIYKSMLESYNIPELSPFKIKCSSKSVEYFIK